MKFRSYYIIKISVCICLAVFQILIVNDSFYLSSLNTGGTLALQQDSSSIAVQSIDKQNAVVIDSIHRDNKNEIQDEDTISANKTIEGSITTESMLPRSLEEPTIPTNISNYPITHKGHSLSFNLTTHCPNWVAWKLTKEMTNGRWARSNDYRSDRLVPFDHRVDEKAFSGSGYDRGHMCPAGDMSWDSEAMSATFLMSNMCPQAPTLNQRWWEHLESACRRWANQEGEIYICCGPMYSGSGQTISSYPTVTVPSAFFKVIISLCPGREKGIGFFYLNNDSRQTMTDAVRTIDEIEELTGYDFFPLLDDGLENKIESMSNLNKWN